MSQLVKAVMALHAHHVIHRDLKPSNVMVTRDGRVVVLDFGLALESQQLEASASQIVGTPAYMAPEQAGGEKITGACDWYAVGVMLYEGLCGELPFVGRPLEVLRRKREAKAPALTDADLPQRSLRTCGASADRRRRESARSAGDRPVAVSRRDR